MKDHFAKGPDCPASHDLDAFQRGNCDAWEARDITAHIRECEFCEAEIAFYARFSGDLPNEELEMPAMPEPLRELAEAIFAGQSDSILDLEFLVEGTDRTAST
jgi:hypothetical protein